MATNSTAARGEHASVAAASSADLGGHAGVHHATERTALLVTPALSATPLLATGLLFAAYGLGWGSWWARLPGYKEQLGASDQGMGAVLASNALGNFVALPFASMLSRQVGAKRFATSGAVAFSAMLSVAPRASGVRTALAAQVGLGAASALFNVAINDQGVRLEAARARPCLSSLHGIFSLGTLLGSALGAAAAGGQLPLSAHMATVSIALAAVALACGPQLTAGPAETQQRSHAAQLTATLLLLGLLSALTAVGEGALNEWTSIYLRENLHASLQLAGAGSLEGVDIQVSFSSARWHGQ